MAYIGSTRLIPDGGYRIDCELTGMVPGTLHQIEVQSDLGLVLSQELRTDVGDVVPSTGDTSAVLFALGAIVVSLVALLSIGRYMDVKAGRLHARSAHVYIAPAMLALAVLTFYPVLYDLAFIHQRRCDTTWRRIVGRVGQFHRGVHFLRFPEGDRFHPHLTRPT